jgi:hypothetical protein
VVEDYYLMNEEFVVCLDYETETMAYTEYTFGNIPCPRRANAVCPYRSACFQVSFSPIVYLQPSCQSAGYHEYQSGQQRYTSNRHGNRGRFRGRD